MNGGVPIESELPFSIIGLRLNRPALQGVEVYAAEIPALRFHIDIGCVCGIGKRPEAVSAKQVFPAAIGNPSRVLRIPHPNTVVLQSSKNVIRIGIVDAHVIKLRNRQIVAFPPGVAAVVGVPDAAIVAGDEMIGIVGIYPNRMKIPMRSVANTAKALAAILAHNQGEVGLVNLVFVFRIDD